MPELDELGRPAWLFSETVHSSCSRAGYYDEGVFATEAGDETCLVELGCWGPVVQCNIAERGVIDGNGGCMTVGGICIGCIMPGFPDRFSPFFERPNLAAGATPVPVPGRFLRSVQRVRRRHQGSGDRRPPFEAMHRRRATAEQRFFRPSPLSR